MAADDSPVWWQSTSCPSWCSITHQDDDHVHDRKHVAIAQEIPALVLREKTLPMTGSDSSWDATRLLIQAYQRDGENITTMYIGDGCDQRLELDQTTTRLLVMALAAYRTES